MLIWHLIGCTYWSIVGGDDTDIDGNDVEQWSMWNPPLELVLFGTFRKQYIYAFYWSVMSVAGSMPNQPTSTEQETFSMIVAFIGIMAGGWIMGSITNLISSLDAEALDWQNKTDEVVRYMARQGVPSEVVDKVHSYYEYMCKCCTRRTHRGSAGDEPPPPPPLPPAPIPARRRGDVPHTSVGLPGTDEIPATKAPDGSGYHAEEVGD